MPMQRRFPGSSLEQAFLWFHIGACLGAGLKIDIGAGAPAPAAVAPAAPETVAGVVVPKPKLPKNIEQKQPLETGQPPPPPPPSYPPSDYDNNGMDWKMGMCFSRERQSPINFDDHIKDPPSDVLKYHYEPIRNVKLQMQASKGLLYIDTSHMTIGEVVHNGDLYPLVRIDFHAQSEHLLKGKRFSMEIQLVHRKINDPTKSLVIAVPVWSEKVPQPIPIPVEELLSRPVGPWYPPKNTEVDHNAVLQQFLTVRPPYEDQTVVDIIIPMAKPLDLGYFIQNPALPDTSNYIQYAGSLTTPPCSDSTTWFVRRVPMIASDAQTRAFANSVFRLTNKRGNFRAVMPVNQRHLRVYRAQWVIDLQLGRKRLPLGPHARTDKEFEAEKLADMAKELSNDAVDYMSDFGKRLRRSSKGLVKNLEKGKDIKPPSPTNYTIDEWEQAVVKMQGNMQEIVGGVMHSVDSNMRKQTMKLHKQAAEEAEKARQMTTAWQTPDGKKQGIN